MDAILAYDLTKQYENCLGLNGLNLQVPQGEIFGCIGERGCGKTTLLRLLSGLCKPTRGECTVMGYSPSVESGRLHTVTGVVLDTARLYGHMTLSANLSFFAGLNGISASDALDRASFLMHKLDIFEGRDVPADKLSTSVARRASLARALMHRPKLLLMDDLAEGMDHEATEAIRSLLWELEEEEGMTVLLCTQNPFYAQRICHRFAILREGALAARGDLESLRKAVGLKYKAVLRFLPESPVPENFVFEEGSWQKEISSEREMPELVSQAVAKGAKICEAKVLQPTLWEIYRQYLATGLRREEAEDGTENTVPGGPQGQGADAVSQTAADSEPAPEQESEVQHN